MGYLEKVYEKSPVPLQTVLLNLKAAELYAERYGGKFRRVFNAFQRNQWRSENELAEYQDEMLSFLVNHAYRTVPYYREIMDGLKLTPKDVKSVDDLHKLPILTKEEIKRNQKRLVSSDYKRKILRNGHTSGTTGSPLDLVYDIATCVVHHAADWRQKYWAGMKCGEPYASLQGRLVVPLSQQKPPFWRKNFINNQLFFSSFHLKEENIGHYIEALELEGIRFLEGYPSNLYILSMYLIKHGKRMDLDAVLTSSETLFEYQKEAIERAFGCKVFDFYGMAERVVFATECEKHEGHHLNSDYGITEFLNNDSEPVEPGEMGRIVATGIHNLAMPLIRYQTNDLCALKKGACSCGRGFPLMEDVATKHESIVTLPDGRLLSPSVLTHPFKPMRNIVESQIIQNDLADFLVKIVRTKLYSKEDENRLVAAFHERMGDNVNIRVEYCRSIPRTKNGKFRWVISKIEPKI